ncbi:MAG: ATP-binding protein [Candidatus Margulisbacteria bacterium]|nr:ATP-binding protein [Candidatus Margulisiibacteriota bacterium]
MKHLKLCGMISVYDEVITRSVKRKASMGVVLYELMTAEIENRKLKSIQNRLRIAKFPEHKDLHDFIFTDTPINQDQVMQLYTGEFIKSSRNVIFVGGTGSAKAVRDGFKARFFNLVDLANQLEREKLDSQDPHPG